MMTKEGGSSTTSNSSTTQANNNRTSASHKISSYELRERLKNSRDEAIAAAAASATSASSYTMTTIHPTAVGRRKRSKSNVTTRKEIIKTKTERKNSIFDSLEKFDDPKLSFRGINKPVRPAPYDSKDGGRDAPRSNNDAINSSPSKPQSNGTLGTSGSMSLGGSEQTQPPRTERSNNEIGNSSTTSFERRGGNGSLDSSLDLSSHHGKPKNSSGHSHVGGDIISTQATQEQWARFKLLGRTGLDEIKVDSKALQQLIDRNFDILKKRLKNIVAIRDDIGTINHNSDGNIQNDDESGQQNNDSNSKGNNIDVDFRTGHLLDEVKETIDFATAAALLKELKRDPDSVQLSQKVEDQLRDYIMVISAMYRNNPFHNFEHASTVLGSVNKLIGLVAQRPDDIGMTDEDNDLSKYGYGVTNDPWIQFALVFSALIHDVDHAGVSNAQLIKEKSLVAGAYKNRSVAEQNSIELAWNLLMEPCYKEFREQIFATPSECSRFRSLVVTAVMATDIADKELAKLRKDRASDNDGNGGKTNNINCKATYVVETLIQAADISHTYMYTFGTYKKWNQKLFHELSGAYKQGRGGEKPPEEFWYNGEFGFFDFYIVPLCGKLKDCGIFEKAAEGFLQNAKNNRKAWEELGESLVASYLREYDEENQQHQKRRGKKKPSTKSKWSTAKNKIQNEENDNEESSSHSLSADMLASTESSKASKATASTAANSSGRATPSSDATSGRVTPAPGNRKLQEDHHHNHSCDSSTESPLASDYESIGSISDVDDLEDSFAAVTPTTPKKQRITALRAGTKPSYLPLSPATTPTSPNKKKIGTANKMNYPSSPKSPVTPTSPNKKKMPMRGKKTNGNHAPSSPKSPRSPKAPKRASDKMNHPPPSPKSPRNVKADNNNATVRVKRKSKVSTSAASSSDGKKKVRSKSFVMDANDFNDGGTLVSNTPERKVAKKIRSKSVDADPLQRRRARSRSRSRGPVLRRGSNASGSSTGSGGSKKDGSGKKGKKGKLSTGSCSTAPTRGREVKKATARGRKAVRSKSRDFSKEIAMKSAKISLTTATSSNDAKSVVSAASTMTATKVKKQRRSRSNEAELTSRLSAISPGNKVKIKSSLSGEQREDAPARRVLGFGAGKKIRLRSKSLEPTDKLAENKKKERRASKRPVKPKGSKKASRSSAVQSVC